MKPLRAVNELINDSMRQSLDEAVLPKIFGVPKALLATGGPLDLFRRKFAVEPTIADGKRQASSETEGIETD